MYFFVKTQNPRPTFHEHDPANGLWRYDVFPMPRAVVAPLRG